MTTPLYPFPGGEGCPLELFRARVIRALWTVVALAPFALAFAIVCRQ